MTEAKLTASLIHPQAASGDDESETVVAPRTEAVALGEQLAAAVALSRVMSGRRPGRMSQFKSEVTKFDRFLSSVLDRYLDVAGRAPAFWARNAEGVGVALMIVVTLATVAVVVSQAIVSSRQERAAEQASVTDPTSSQTLQRLRREKILNRGRPKAPLN